MRKTIFILFAFIATTFGEIVDTDDNKESRLSTINLSVSVNERNTSSDKPGKFALPSRSVLLEENDEEKAEEASKSDHKTQRSKASIPVQKLGSSLKLENEKERQTIDSKENIDIDSYTLKQSRNIVDSKPDVNVIQQMTEEDFEDSEDFDEEWKPRFQIALVKNPSTLLKNILRLGRKEKQQDNTEINKDNVILKRVKMHLKPEDYEILTLLGKKTGNPRVYQPKKYLCHCHEEDCVGKSCEQAAIRTYPTWKKVRPIFNYARVPIDPEELEMNLYDVHAPRLQFHEQVPTTFKIPLSTDSLKNQQENEQVYMYDAEDDVRQFQQQYIPTTTRVPLVSHYVPGKIFADDLDKEEIYCGTDLPIFQQTQKHFPTTFREPHLTYYTPSTPVSLVQFLQRPSTRLQKPSILSGVTANHPRVIMPGVNVKLSQNVQPAFTENYSSQQDPTTILENTKSQYAGSQSTLSTILSGKPTNDHYSQSVLPKVQRIVGSNDPMETKQSTEVTWNDRTSLGRIFNNVEDCVGLYGREYCISDATNISHDTLRLPMPETNVVTEHAADLPVESKFSKKNDKQETGNVEFDWTTLFDPPESTTTGFRHSANEYIVDHTDQAVSVSGNLQEPGNKLSEGNYESNVDHKHEEKNIEQESQSILNAILSGKSANDLYSSNVLSKIQRVIENDGSTGTKQSTEATWDNRTLLGKVFKNVEDCVELLGRQCCFIDPANAVQDTLRSPVLETNVAAENTADLHAESKLPRNDDGQETENIKFVLSTLFDLPESTTTRFRDSSNEHIVHSIDQAVSISRNPEEPDDDPSEDYVDDNYEANLNHDHKNSTYHTKNFKHPNQNQFLEEAIESASSHDTIGTSAVEHESNHEEDVQDNRYYVNSVSTSRNPEEPDDDPSEDYVDDNYEANLNHDHKNSTYHTKNFKHPNQNQFLEEAIESASSHDTIGTSAVEHESNHEEDVQDNRYYVNSVSISRNPEEPDDDPSEDYVDDNYEANLNHDHKNSTYHTKNFKHPNQNQFLEEAIESASSHDTIGTSAVEHESNHEEDVQDNRYYVNSEGNDENFETRIEHPVPISEYFDASTTENFVDKKSHDEKHEEHYLGDTSRAEIQEDSSKSSLTSTQAYSKIEEARNPKVQYSDYTRSPIKRPVNIAGKKIENSQDPYATVDRYSNRGYENHRLQSKYFDQNFVKAHGMDQPRIYDAISTFNDKPSSYDSTPWQRPIGNIDRQTLAKINGHPDFTIKNYPPYKYPIDQRYPQLKKPSLGYHPMDSFEERDSLYEERSEEHVEDKVKSIVAEDTFEMSTEGRKEIVEKELTSKDLEEYYSSDSEEAGKEQLLVASKMNEEHAKIQVTGTELEKEWKGSSGSSEKNANVDNSDIKVVTNSYFTSIAQNDFDKASGMNPYFTSSESANYNDPQEPTIHTEDILAESPLRKDNESIDTITSNFEKDPVKGLETPEDTRVLSKSNVSKMEPYEESADHSRSNDGSFEQKVHAITPLTESTESQIIKNEECDTIGSSLAEQSTEEGVVETNSLKETKFLVPSCASDEVLPEEDQMSESIERNNYLSSGPTTDTIILESEESSLANSLDNRYSSSSASIIGQTLQEQSTKSLDYAKSGASKSGSEYSSSPVGDKKTIDAEEPKLEEDNFDDHDLTSDNNKFLKATIKRIINDFASEREIDLAQDALRSAKIMELEKQELLPEIVNTPTLRHIFSSSLVEDMMLNMVRNVLSQNVGATMYSSILKLTDDIIRSGLRNVISKIEGSLPNDSPIIVEEHAFKGGKWITERVTLLPTERIKDRKKISLRETLNRIVRQTIESILKESRVKARAVRQPIVERVIVKTVKNVLKKEDNESVRLIRDSMILEAVRDLVDELENDGMAQIPKTVLDSITEPILRKSAEDTDEASLYKEKSFSSEDISLQDYSKSSEKIVDDTLNVSNVPVSYDEENPTEMTDDLLESQDLSAIGAKIKNNYNEEIPKMSNDQRAQGLLETSPIKYYTPNDRILEYIKKHGQGNLRFSNAGKVTENIEDRDILQHSLEDMDPYPEVEEFTDTAEYYEEHETTNEQGLGIERYMEEEEEEKMDKEYEPAERIKSQDISEVNDSLEATRKENEPEEEFVEPEYDVKTNLESSAKSSGREDEMEHCPEEPGILGDVFASEEYVISKFSIDENLGSHEGNGIDTLIKESYRDENPESKYQSDEKYNSNEEVVGSGEPEENTEEDEDVDSSAMVESSKEMLALPSNDSTEDNVVASDMTSIDEEHVEEKMTSSDLVSSAKTGEEDEDVQEAVSAYSSEPDRDFKYFGKIITGRSDDFENDLTDLIGSDLYYVGDEVKLPLTIKKLKDGSYALSISESFCDRILNRKCPCCVPRKGKVVQKRRNVRKRDSKKIDKVFHDKSKEDWEKDLEEEEDKKELKNRSVRAISSVSKSIVMPVDVFAKRYNLTLNLLDDFRTDERKKEETEEPIIIENRIKKFDDDKKKLQTSKENVESLENLEKYDEDDDLIVLENAVKLSNEMDRKMENSYPMKSLASINDIPKEKRTEVLINILKNLIKEEPMEAYAIVDGERKKLGTLNEVKHARDTKEDEDEDEEVALRYGYQINNPILKRIKFVKYNQTEQGQRKYQKFDDTMKKKLELLKTILHWLKNILLSMGTDGEQQLTKQNYST